MRFDPLITNAGRLTILTALLDETRQDFVTLRKATQLTDGNLTTHARKLAGAGMIAIEKSSREGRPVTYLNITEQGRAALKRHVDKLTSSMTHVVQATISPIPEPSEQGVWVD